MAEQYRRSVLGETGPAFNLTNIEESIRGSRDLQKRLDAVSQYALKDMTQTAIREGEEYAVKNRPSLKQISTALHKGEDVKKLFSQPGTVFGDAARKVQADLFRQDMTNTLTMRIVDASNAIDRGMFNMDAETFANDIQANIDGAYNVLADIDVDQALKFKAAGTNLAHTVYEKILKKQTEQYLDGLKLEADTLEESYRTILSDNLRNTNGNLPQAVLKSITHKQSILDAYDRLPGAEGDIRLQKLNKLEQEVYVQSAITTLETNPALLNSYKTYNSLLKNDPPAELDFYRYLSPENKDKVVKGYREALKNRDAIEKDLQDKATRDDLIRVNELTELYYETKDPAILGELEDISLRNPNAIKIEGIEKIKDGAYKVDPARKLSYEADLIKEKIDNGEFDNVQSLYLYTRNKGYTDEETAQIFGPYFASKRIRQEEKEIKAAAINITPDSKNRYILDKNQDKIKQRIKEMEEEHNATNPDVPFNRTEATKQITDGILQDRKYVQLNTYVQDLQKLFETYKMLEYYDEKIMDSSLSLKDNRIQVILARIEKVNPERAKAIRIAMSNIEKLRIEIESQP